MKPPTTALCETCHENEVAQYNQSRHGLPAYVAYAGQEVLSPEHMEMYESIPEGGALPEVFHARNSLHALKGPAITRFACEACHNIGKPAADGSVGQCQGGLSGCWPCCHQRKTAVKVPWQRLEKQRKIDG